jgi:hypothetical protein
MNEAQDEEVMAMSAILPEAFTFNRAQNRGRLTIKPGNMLSKRLCSPAKGNHKINQNILNCLIISLKRKYSILC